MGERWGYACCKETDRAVQCPQPAEQTPESEAPMEPGNKRRKVSEAVPEVSPNNAAGPNLSNEEDFAPAAESESSSLAAQTEVSEDFVKAAELRKRSATAVVESKENTSTYLADLLSDPAGTASCCAPGEPVWAVDLDAGR